MTTETRLVRTACAHLLGLAAGFVLTELRQVNDSLPQQLVWTHQGSVQDLDVQRGALLSSTSPRLLRQVKGGLLLPHRGHAFLRHRGLVLLLPHLHDRERIIGAPFPLDLQAPGLEHRYLDAGGTPLLIRQGHPDTTLDCWIK